MVLPGGMIRSSTRSLCAASMISDGDGIGDFNGIIEKLDYLNDGDPHNTTPIWVLPDLG